jgi:integrase
MASLIKESGRDSWKLRWHDAQGRRCSIGLGVMPKKSAEQFKNRFEELQGVVRSCTPIPASLCEWLNKIDDELHGRLASKGLVDPRAKRSLKAFCDSFQESRRGIAEATSTRDKQVINLLIEYFGGDRSIDKITPEDAESWRNWLKDHGNKRDSKRAELSDNTVRRRTGVASQIFSKAIQWKLIRENPFDGLEKSLRENPDRMQYVPWSDVLKLIDVAPNAEWRALLAFLRLTGCRAPSEVHDLRWSDLDFADKKITIRSPKTRHLGGRHAVRSCPMFVELVPYLEELADVIGPGINVPMSERVFPVVKDGTTNLRTPIERMIKLAGMQQWPKLIQNLRSSRETELLDSFPVKDVCDWFGNSPAIVAKHYAQSRSEFSELAKSQPTVGFEGSKEGPIRDKKGSKTGLIIDPQESTTTPHHRSNPNENQGDSSIVDDACDDCDGYTDGRYWTRTTPENPRKNADSQHRGVQRGTQGDSIPVELAELWSKLTDAQQAELMQMARAMACQVER